MKPAAPHVLLQRSTANCGTALIMPAAFATTVATAVAIAIAMSGCSDEKGTGQPADAALADSADSGDDGTIIWADVPGKDSWSPIIDTKAPPKDTGVDISEPDVAADVAELPKPATLPGDLPPDVQAIGVVATELEEDGKTKVLKVVLPAGTVSFLAVVLGQHPGHFTVATAVTPKGDLLSKGQCQPLCTSCKNRIAAAPATGAVLFPNASGVVVTGGVWHLSACGFEWKQQGSQFSIQPLVKAAIDMVVLARVRPDGKVPAAGRLKVRTWWAGSYPNAAQSFDDPNAVVMLAAAATALATAGIELAIIDRINAPGGFAQIQVADGLTTDHSSNADNLFAAAKTVGGSAVVDVFIVDSLVGGKEGGVQVHGWAGGVPGPGFFVGRPRAGIVIALKDLADGHLAGRQLAHEIGHYLGLFNSTEAAGTMHDPLDSTPQCPSSADSDGNGLLTAKECASHDGTNAMFWRPGPGAATFTSEQGAIMRGNPLVWAK